MRGRLFGRPLHRLFDEVRHEVLHRHVNPGKETLDLAIQSCKLLLKKLSNPISRIHETKADQKGISKKKRRVRLLAIQYTTLPITNAQ